MTEPTGERFVPEAMGGELIEAQHHARYRLAAQQASGRRVLDAGCGVGWGAALLLDAGAQSVAGVDISVGAVEDATARAAEGRFVVGDLHELPFGDASFDLVTCFEAIEHVEEPRRALDELARVLATNGLLFVSSPNPQVYPPGNPFHIHEFAPDELHAELAERFPTAVLWRQYDLTSSLLVEGRPFAPGDPIESEVLSVIPLVDDHDMYSVVVAGTAPLPSLGAIAMFAPQTEVRDLRGIYEELARAHEELHRSHANLNSHLQHAQREADLAAGRAAELESELAKMRASRSWRATAILRSAGDVVRKVRKAGS
jgi:SAM-dependent methyltransferase